MAASVVGMTFEDLPPNWRTLPVDTTPGLAADVVDLTVSLGDRESGCVCLIVLGPDGRAVTPLVVTDLPPEADPARIGNILDGVAPLVVEVGGALVFARGRRGGVLLDDRDRRWHDHLLEGCRRHRVRLAGAFLATPATVRSFPQPFEAPGITCESDPSDAGTGAAGTVAADVDGLAS